jgi:hypothetical protein
MTLWCGIHNFGDCCYHVYSSYGSAIQQYTDSTSISWESVYKISLGWVDMLISYVHLFGIVSGVMWFHNGSDKVTVTMQSSWILPIEKSKVTETEKGETGEEQSQESVLTIFFDIKWVFHKEFILAGQAVNSAYYCDVLQWLWKCGRRTLVTKELAVASQQRTISHIFTREFFTKNIITVVSHPPYLPDLAPCNSSLFPWLRIKQKGRHFDTAVVTMAELQMVLNTLTEQDFLDAFKKRQ